MSCGCDYKFKCVVVGNTGVGKSCLQTRFVSNNFDKHKEYEATIGVGYSRRAITVNDRQIELVIWDTAGQERFRALSRSYYRDAAGAMLVYDITRRDTFVHITTWLEEIQQHASPNLPIMLIGNKCDLDRKRAVLEDEGEEFARQHGLLFFEASAVTGQNVEQAFFGLSEKIYEKIQKGEIDVTKQPGIVLGCRGNQVEHDGRYGPISQIEKNCCSS